MTGSRLLFGQKLNYPCWGRSGYSEPDMGFLFNMDKINLKEWKCANTYDNNYGSPPESSGIYLFLTLSYTKRYRELIYIGQSNNLYKRFINHTKLDDLCLLYDHIQFYWFSTSDHIQLEKKLIKKYKPKFNIQHNG